MHAAYNEAFLGNHTGLNMQTRQQITIRGCVQGVGCRPFIYRIAVANGLSGTVRNDTRGVTLEVQGSRAVLDAFTAKLKDPSLPGYPPRMEVAECNVKEIAVVENDAVFQIIESDDSGQPVSQVTPDCATCSTCLNEIRDADDFRYRYPLINCTHCGPR